MNKILTLTAVLALAFAGTTFAAQNPLDVSGLKKAQEHKVWGADMMQHAQKQEPQQVQEQKLDANGDPRLQKIIDEDHVGIVKGKCEHFAFDDDWGESRMRELSNPTNPRDQLDVCLKLGQINQQDYREAVKSHLKKHPENADLFKDFDKDWKD